MAETPESLAYAESSRAIEQQSRRVDELRSRTGLLLAGASVVTSFLGAETLNRDEAGILGVLAILAFLGVVGVSLWIILPRRKAWRFVVGAKTLLEDWVDEPRSGDVAAMQRFLATTLEHNYDCNEGILESSTGASQSPSRCSASRWFSGPSSSRKGAVKNAQQEEAARPAPSRSLKTGDEGQETAGTASAP